MPLKLLIYAGEKITMCSILFSYRLLSLIKV